MLIQTVDQYVDRERAAKRLAVVTKNLPNLRTLANKCGSFKGVADYLLASLLAFQNLNEESKRQLQTIFSEYDQKPVPQDIKTLAMGFVFLTQVGENHFAEVLKQALEGLGGRNTPEDAPDSHNKPPKSVSGSSAAPYGDHI